MAGMKKETDRTDIFLTPRSATRADEDLVADVLRGGAGSFELLVKRHETSIFGFLFRMMRNPEEAADLTQEVFLKVFANLEQFNPEYRFKTWLYRIASNAAVDRSRRRKHLRMHTAVLAEEEDISMFPTTDPGPEALLAARETRERLASAIERMPGAYRDVLLMRVHGDLRYDEIARATRLPIGTVKNRIFRAREILKREIA
jgi:RNA polymerase sigma-70 factor (ECF subfamily)